MAMIPLREKIDISSGFRTRIFSRTKISCWHASRGVHFSWILSVKLGDLELGGWRWSQRGARSEEQPWVRICFQSCIATKPSRSPFCLVEYFVYFSAATQSSFSESNRMKDYKLWCDFIMKKNVWTSCWFANTYFLLDHLEFSGENVFLMTNEQTFALEEGWEGGWLTSPVKFERFIGDETGQQLSMGAT
jgi:hypothetical protein